MSSGKIFISYRRSDSGFASVAIKNLLLYRYLHEDQIFMDLDSIRPGEPFPAKLDEALNECNVVVAIIGSTWLEEIQQRAQPGKDEDFVRMEIASTLARKTPIIPVVLDGAQMPNAKDLPADIKALSEKNAVDIGFRKFDSDVAKLVKGLRLYGVESSKPPPTISGPTREQREVTTLIAHVHGLEELCLEHPGETGEALLVDCMRALDGAALDHDGFVSRDTGSRIVAFFGAPDAHDDDPDRACMAALQMRSVLARFAHERGLGAKTALSLSAGIDVGRVTSGKVGPKGTFGIVGSAGVRADELTRQAAPGEILVSDAISARCGARFTCAEPREITLSHGHRVKAHPLLSTVSGTSREYAGGLIGRIAERDELRGRLANRPAHPWIELVGPMGIGKTRLVRAATDGIDARVVHVLASRVVCQRPLGFLRQLMTACMQTLTSHPDWDRDIAAFEDALAALDADVEMFAEVLWPLVAPDGSTEPSREDPAARRRRTERGLNVFLEGLSTDHDHALWLDSYDHVDEESAGLLEGIATTGVPDHIQFVISQRGNARAPLFSEKVISLAGLPDEDARQLLAQGLRGATLPAALQQEMLQRAEGVPLFLEEMVQSMRQDGLLEGGPEGPWVYTPPKHAGHPPLPASIRAAMTARLDRLSNQAGLILCQASVQGAEFQPEVIRRLHKTLDNDGSAQGVDALLAELQRQDLIKSCAGGATELMAFSNPIMEDVCYERLVPDDRKALHQRTAEILCAIAGDPQSVPPDLLARHYDAAELWSHSVAAHTRAGDDAASLFANTRAVSQYNAALRAADRTEASAGEINRLRARALERLAALELRLGNYGAALIHATLLCETAPCSRDLAEGLRLRALATRYKGEVAAAEEMFEQAIAKTGGDGEVREVQIRIMLDFAELLYHENRPSEALQLIQRMREDSQEAPPAVRMQISILAGKITRGLGRFEQSKDLFDDAYREAMMDGTKTEIAKALINRGILERDLGNYRRSEQHFAKSLELWKQVGDEEWMAGSSLNIGMVALSIGDYAKALDHFTAAKETFRHMGNVERVALADANFALLYLEQDKPANALEHADDALRMIGSTRGWLRGLVKQVRGDANLQLRNTDEAAQDFESALAEFRPEDHPEVAAGCIRGLGRVAFRRGHAEEALTQLTDAAGRFERLHRKQEAGRTLADIGQVRGKLGQVDEAADAFSKAITLLESIKVPNDVQRVKRMLAVLPINTPSSDPCKPTQPE